MGNVDVKLGHHIGGTYLKDLVTSERTHIEPPIMLVHILIGGPYRRITIGCSLGQSKSTANNKNARILIHILGAYRNNCHYEADNISYSDFFKWNQIR